MHKSVISTLTAFSLLLSMGARADAPSLDEITTEFVAEEMSSSTIADAQEETDVSAPESEEEGTPVSHASGETSKAAKRNQWKNALLAVAAVAVAVTALILVSHNNGKHKSSDS